MPRILNDKPRDFVSSVRSGEKLILTNNRTGRSLELPRDASPAERRAGVQALQEQIADPFTGVSAKEAVQRMYGTPEQKSDAPPVVALTPGKLRDKQLAAAAEYERQREQDRKRQLEIEDRKALVRDLAAELREPPAEPVAETPAVQIGYDSARDVARESYIDALLSGAPAERVAETRGALLKFGEPPATEGGANE